MMWAEHVERMGGERSISNHSAYKFLLVYSLIRVSFKRVLFALTRYMGIRNSIEMYANIFGILGACK
jgi:hypothetical protein